MDKQIPATAEPHLTGGGITIWIDFNGDEFTAYTKTGHRLGTMHVEEFKSFVNGMQ